MSTCECTALAATGQVWGLWENERKEERGYTTLHKRVKSTPECIKNIKAGQCFNLCSPDKVRLWIKVVCSTKGNKICRYTSSTNTSELQEASYVVAVIHITCTWRHKSSRHTYPASSLSVHAVTHVYPAQLHHQCHQAGDSAQSLFHGHHYSLAMLAVSEKQSAVWTYLRFLLAEST